MSTRQIVSYDDITLPYEDIQVSGGSPPVKKRKKNNQKAKQINTRKPPQIPSRENSVDIPEEQSRELTHEEIWDDSALVDAWEAAQQEYEMYHGTSKNWKNELVKQSALWYNVPVDQAAKGTSGASTSQSSNPVPQPDNVEPAEPDSQPLNFDTFVPTHDPSLPTPLQNHVETFSGSMVSQDEAFSRAMTAMYWGGYWTAMYHCQRHLPNSSPPDDAENEADEFDAEGETEEG